MYSDPSALACWLYEQCRTLGVTFVLNRTVYAVGLATDLSLTHVLTEASDTNDARSKLECCNLVVAAGAYTTGIFTQVFPESTLVLENHIQKAHWIHADHESVSDESSAAVRIPDAAASTERLGDEVVMALQPPSKILTISAISSSPVSRDLTSSNALDPGRGKVSDLRLVAAKYLNSEVFDIVDKNKYDWKGRSELSTGNSHNPIIDRVKPSGLGYVCTDEEDMHPRGVWLCYGFGRYGTTLAPGAARMLVSRMIHGCHGMDNYDFSLPEYTKPKLNGKGKGRASLC